MNTENMVLRTASVDDAGELLAIYEPYVRKTAITFEYDVPSREEFARRIANTLQKYPYLVAERNHELLGYAYTGPFVGRAAYGWGAEVSIYVREDCKKQGIGRLLYHGIEEVSRAQNILNLNACIGNPEVEDEYLTKNSIQFHAHLGYRMVGNFYKCGYKFGRWYHMVWMEKIIGHHVPDPAPVIPFPKLPAEALQNAGICVKPTLPSLTPA